MSTTNRTQLTKGWSVVLLLLGLALFLCGWRWGYVRNFEWKGNFEFDPVLTPEYPRPFGQYFDNYIKDQWPLVMAVGFFVALFASGILLNNSRDQHPCHQVRFFTLLCGALLSTIGVLRGGWALVLVWLGLSFLWLGFAHMSGWHAAFAKRADGTLPLWSKMLHLPFFLYTWLVWHVIRLISREPFQNQVTEQLVIGRRLLGSELKDQFSNIVDLTAEFQEPAGIRRLPGYVCFPILDASAPAPESMQAVIAKLRPGKTYVHCAQGHGRTALFALAMLLTTGEAKDIEEGLCMLSKVRPGIRLNATQRRCVEAFAPTVN